MCSCQRTFRTFLPQLSIMAVVSANYILQVVGVTGFEPVTLRLSSACSNQLSYTPARFYANLNGISLRLKVGGAEESRTPDL